MWVFGNSLYSYFLQKFPFVVPILGYFMHKRIIFSLIFLTLLFMIIYKWIPNRVSSFRKQFPGALIATLGWVAVSVGCSIYMDNFTNFSYIYGSMAGIMILLLWLYFCMSMVFYGAEVNYFLENKDNYHLLIRTLRPIAINLPADRYSERVQRHCPMENDQCLFAPPDSYSQQLRHS